MASSFDPAALMSRSHALPRGPRVRLRLARPRDLASVRALLERAGADAPELQAARLVRADPRRTLVICATGLVGSSETLVGVGEIELGPDSVATGPIAYVDDELTEGLDELLSNALLGRVRARAA
jgi:hypothetical protein